MNTTLMVWFLLAAGTLYLIIRDQRYRCRVCLRRLRMPVETGSRGLMLQLGRPRTEYICLYGHGTLKEEDTATSVLDGPVWTPHSDDIWAELVAAGKEDQERESERESRRVRAPRRRRPRSVTRANRFSSSGVRRQGR